MPLRDHFHLPLSRKRPWSRFHAQWPAEIVRHLSTILPEGFYSALSVYLGSSLEVDIGTYKEDYPEERDAGNSGGGTATLTALAPTLTIEFQLADQDRYEVSIYDDGGDLVAVIEIVSPANKDRPESRELFVGKVLSLLSQGICVSIVDLVSVRQANLYSELLSRLGHADPKLGSTPPAMVAVTMRTRSALKRRPLLDAWYYPMIIGQALPTLPIWLRPDLCMMLSLETSYEETCRVLKFDLTK